MEKEAFFLGQIAEYPDIVVPEVLGYGKDGSIEYTLMTRMPGVPALSVESEGADRTNLIHQLGRTMRRIHSIPQDPLPVSGTPDPAGVSSGSSRWSGASCPSH